MQRQFADVGLAEPAVTQQAFNQLAADHAGRSQNQNVQGQLLTFLDYRAAAPFLYWSMTLSENRYPLFRITLYSFTAPVIADT
jgi:hypothetical protein